MQGKLALSIALAALSLFSVPAFAQVDVSTATLRGAVLDPNGAGVPHARITATNLSKEASQSTQTADDGTYNIPLLEPGAYDLIVESPGFAKAIIKGVQLSVGQAGIYDVHLTVGSVKNVVEVTAEPAVIQVEQVQQANTVNRNQIENLPNISRNFTDSIFTLPGVVSSDAPRPQNAAAFTGFFTSGFSIGGSNGRNNLVTVDGGENEYGSGQLRTPNISLESVQEFQVNRNAFNAEFGFTAGTAINVVTKSGTNTFHGSGYFYFLNDATEASYYFDSFPAARAFEQNIFPGVTFGGPIIKNKLFFFTSYEYRKLDTPEFRSYLSSPEVEGVTGNPAQLSYLNALRTTGNPYLELIAGALFPALTPTNNPDVTALLTANNGIFDDKTSSHDWIARIDYLPEAHDALTLRFSIERYRYTNIGAPQLLAPDYAANTTRNDNAILLTWNHVFTPALVNTARAQFVPSNTSTQNAFLPNTAQLSIGSLGNFQQSYTNPYSLTQQRYQFEDTVSWTRGRHNMKFGGSYRPVDYAVTNDLWFSGEFDFYEGTVPLIALVPSALQPALVQFNLASGLPATGDPATNLSALQSFSLGIPILYRQGFGNPHWQSWANYLGLFAQDSWKASSTFTLDYGLRMDYDAEPSPVPHNTYLSPRLGIAWDITGDQKTVFRAGGGIFVSPVYFQVPYLVNLLNDSGKYINQIAEQLSATSNLVAELWGLGVQQGKLPFGQLTESDLALFGITPGPYAPGRVIFSLGSNYKNNYTIQSSASIQRQLLSNMSLEVGYLLYRGVHIPLSEEINYAETGVIDPIYGPQYSPINPTIAQNNAYSSVGNSIYNGMTVSLSKRYSQGLQLQANYTWSKSIDDVTDFNSAFGSFWPTRQYLDRGISTFNVTNNFVANAVYTTPFKAGTGGFWSHVLSDITLSPIVYARSGIPFTITVPGAQNGTEGHSLYARPWYIARNTGIGPAFYSFDMQLSKSFYMNRERGVQAQVIIEGRNLLNHTNFTAVNNVFPVGDPFLTQGPFNVTGSKALPPSVPLGFTAASNPRQLTFGLKLAF